MEDAATQKTTTQSDRRDGNHYEGEMKDWNPHGTGVITYANGNVYRGEFEDGKPHGAGEVTLPDGAVLSGTWREGDLHGCMTLTTKDDVTEVEYEDGVAAPTGKVKCNDGRRYEGEMKNWNPHGTGVITYANGNVYRGEFADGKPHGAGEATLSDGVVLSGTWREGKRHGCMTLTTKDDVTEVEYADGVAAPTGKVKCNNGRYEGEMKNWNPHGTGVLTHVDGTAHRGEFEDGKPHGAGEATLSDGVVLSGTWREGKRHGCMTLKTKDDVTEVEYADGVAAPTGKVKYNDGRRYEGEMKNFKPHGTGVLSAVDCWEYRGEVAAGKRWGNGVQRPAELAGASSFVASARCVYAGLWHDDQKHGHGIEGSGVEGDIVVAVLYEKGKLLSETPVPVPRLLDVEWHVAHRMYLDATVPDCSAHVDGMMAEYLETVRRDVLDPMHTALTARVAELAQKGTSNESDRLRLDTVRRALARVEALVPQLDSMQTFVEAVRWATAVHEQTQNVGRKTGTYRKRDGGLYEGELEDGIPHGTGVLTLPDGTVHRGEFADGKPHGAGEATLSDGVVLSGTWRKGDLHGCMTLTTKDDVTEVEYADGVAAPTGKVKYNNGRRYEGEMKNWNPHGTGVLTHVDGTVQRGLFADGKPHGPEEATLSDVAVLSGTWREGYWHGCMTMTTKDDVTEVEYADGVAAPTGKVKYNDGRRYEGEMKNWNPHGTGVLTHVDGTAHRGLLADGKPHGPEEATLSDVAVLSGTWREGKRHGCMTLTTKDDVTEVEYADGVAAPTGKVKCNDGRRYEGEMKNWNPHGTGVLTHVDGTVQRGLFADGVLQVQVRRDECDNVAEMRKATIMQGCGIM